MKTATSTFLAALSGAYNRKELLIKFLIWLILFMYLIIHLFVFTRYLPDMDAFNLPLILWITVISFLLFVLLVVRWITGKQKSKKNTIEKTMHELETRALRAQMNPHFIFNCMNSIKALIQQNNNDKAVSYLTTFSKLLRTIFDHSDNCEISLFEEIETCKIYTQLESLRSCNKIQYNFIIDEIISLKSVMVPALILQPFIENAIWHGLMPKKEGGMLDIQVSQKENKICCVVEDNGIGRWTSLQNKYNMPATSHQSKGMRLTKSRLELNNSLNKRNATVEIIDKLNSKNEPGGTKVVIIFNEE
jgi:LytS/YehU family sensor histidine kinase